MIVANLAVVRVAVDEPKTDPPLIIDGDGVLALAVTLERMEAIAGWHLQIVQARRQVDILQFACGSPGDLGGKRLVAPVVNSSRVRLSANVLIIVQ